MPRLACQGSREWLDAPRHGSTSGEAARHRGGAASWRRGIVAARHRGGAAAGAAADGAREEEAWSCSYGPVGVTVEGTFSTAAWSAPLDQLWGGAPERWMFLFALMRCGLRAGRVRRRAARRRRCREGGTEGMDEGSNPGSESTASVRLPRTPHVDSQVLWIGRCDGGAICVWRVALGAGAAPTYWVPRCHERTSPGRRPARVDRAREWRCRVAPQRRRFLPVRGGVQRPIRWAHGA